MPKMENYVCPRCYYGTPLKKLMAKHLARKTPCSDKSGIELSEEVKEYIIKNRTYTSNEVKMGSPSPPNFGHLINSMEAIAKLNHCLEYYGKTIMDANDYFESLHNQTVSKLYDDSFPNPHLVNRDSLMMLVDDLARVRGCNHEEMNVIYDEMLDRIKIFIDDQWESYMIDPGLRRIIEILRTNYLDQYECYLYRKLFYDKRMNATQLNDVRIHLQLYYRFLAIFDLYPLVYTEGMSNIVNDYKSDNPNEFHDFGMKEYTEQSKELTKPEINRTKKEILDIIRKNYKVNLKRLNESILEILRIDTNFRSRLGDVAPSPITPSLDA